MSSPRRLATPAAIAALMCLPGCISGLNSKAPPEQRYTLPLAPDRSKSTLRAVPPDASVKVIRPHGPASLAGARIAVLKPGAHFDYYASARWVDDVPVMMERALVDALRFAGNFAGVESDATPFQATYLLNCEIADFEAQYPDDTGGAPTAVVDLDCTLGRRSDRRVVDRIHGRGTATARTDRMEAVVAAFGVAASSALAAVAVVSPAAGDGTRP